jgi:hypothetical protein
VSEADELHVQLFDGQTQFVFGCGVNPCFVEVVPVREGVTALDGDVFGHPPVPSQAILSVESVRQLV